jgi:hypothetical protein
MECQCRDHRDNYIDEQVFLFETLGIFLPILLDTYGSFISIHCDESSCQFGPTTSHDRDDVMLRKIKEGLFHDFYENICYTLCLKCIECDYHRYKNKIQ